MIRRRRHSHEARLSLLTQTDKLRIMPRPPTNAPLTKELMEARRRTALSRANSLIRQCTGVIESARRDLDENQKIAGLAGMTVRSSILDPTFGATDVLRTTGGYSNTDHVVKVTGDTTKDRLQELKRAYQRRVKLTQPENRGEDRWDKPKIQGERRRRIHREKDMPQAPPEPPVTGYVIFLGQMTAKIRHDRPNTEHHQARVTPECSKIWRYGMTEAERNYYITFAQEAREEYLKLHQEYRATGNYDTSRVKFHKLQGTGPWVHTQWHEKNGLERELSTYDTVKFPPRPPELDEAYQRRQAESIKRRRLKEKREAAMRKKSKSQTNIAEATNPVLPGGLSPKERVRVQECNLGEKPGPASTKVVLSSLTDAGSISIEVTKTVAAIDKQLAETDEAIPEICPIFTQR